MASSIGQKLYKLQILSARLIVSDLTWSGELAELEQSQLADPEQAGDSFP